MRVTDVQEKSVSIASFIRNAYIDFSKMTVSVVAIRTDVIMDGKPVVGYGFNSNDSNYLNSITTYSNQRVIA